LLQPRKMQSGGTKVTYECRNSILQNKTKGPGNRAFFVCHLPQIFLPRRFKGSKTHEVYSLCFFASWRLCGFIVFLNLKVSNLFTWL
jgi:hypothetical protein